MKLLKVINTLEKQKTTKVFVEKVDENVVKVANGVSDFNLKILFPNNIVKVNIYGSIEIDNENTIPVLPNDFIVVPDEVYSKI